MNECGSTFLVKAIVSVWRWDNVSLLKAFGKQWSDTEIKSWGGLTIQAWVSDEKWIKPYQASFSKQFQMCWSQSFTISSSHIKWECLSKNNKIEGERINFLVIILQLFVASPLVFVRFFISVLIWRRPSTSWKWLMKFIRTRVSNTFYGHLKVIWSVWNERRITKGKKWSFTKKKTFFCWLSHFRCCG